MKKFTSHKYIPIQKPYIKYQEFNKIILKDSSLEHFAIIQVLKINGKKLVLEGFSKETSHWLVYEFISPLIEVFKTEHKDTPT